MINKIAILVCGVALVACGSDDEENSEKVKAVVKSTTLQSAAVAYHSPRRAVDLNQDLLQKSLTGLTTLTLVNISGEADSLSVTQSAEDGCSFVAWSAKSQSGAIAVEGRETEAFDMLNPVSWTSTGGGLRDSCNGGPITGGEAFFAYVDLLLDVSGTQYTVRVATGETGNYKAGDVLIKVNDVFNWVDSTGTTLTPETSERPATVAQHSGIKDFVPFLDGGNEKNTVYDTFSITADDASKAKEVSHDTVKVVFDFDLESHGITISDSSSAGKIASTIAVPFLTKTSAPLTAAITPFTQAELDAAEQ